MERLEVHIYETNCVLHYLERTPFQILFCSLQLEEIAGITKFVISSQPQLICDNPVDIVFFLGKLKKLCRMLYRYFILIAQCIQEALFFIIEPSADSWQLLTTFSEVFCNCYPYISGRQLWPLQSLWTSTPRIPQLTSRPKAALEVIDS